MSVEPAVDTPCGPQFQDWPSFFLDRALWFAKKEAKQDATWMQPEYPGARKVAWVQQVSPERLRREVAARMAGFEERAGRREILAKAKATTLRSHFIDSVGRRTYSKSSTCDLHHYACREYDVYRKQVDYGTFIQSRAAGGLADHCGISRSCVPFLCSALWTARPCLLHGACESQRFALRRALFGHIGNPVLLQSSADRVNAHPTHPGIGCFTGQRKWSAGNIRYRRSAPCADSALASKLSAIDEVAAFAGSRPPVHLPGLIPSLV